jgi:hypothetical protein
LSDSSPTESAAATAGTAPAKMAPAAGTDAAPLIPERLVPAAAPRPSRAYPLLLGTLVLAAALLATLLLWRDGADPRATAQRVTARGELLEIEERLTALAFPPGAIDGVADAATAAAIREFQRAAGLAEDGLATPVLLAELRALMGDE